MAERRDVLSELGLIPEWHIREVSAPQRLHLPIAANLPSIPVSEAVNLDQLRSRTIAGQDWTVLTETIKSCTACGLCKTRTNAVPGVGDQHAEWLFVGEAPGADEDRQGEPFVGQAGRLLDNMLASIGLQRGRTERGGTYIANVLKCRPPGNRNPEPTEVAQCTPFLQRQIALIRPRLIVALGKFAAMTLLDTDASIAQLRGRVHRYGDTPLIVTYHPAYLLRSLPDKGKAWEDLCLARATILQMDKVGPT